MRACWLATAADLESIGVIPVFDPGYLMHVSNYIKPLGGV